MRIGIFGFGEIGRLIARYSLRRGHEISGVVDIDERLIDRDAGEILGSEKIGVRISADPAVLKDSDVVLHATSSYLDQVYDQLVSIIKLRKSVISTCETLSYPFYRYPRLAEKLGRLAKEHGVAVIGTGVNPGFLLDTLVIVMAASLGILEKIVARRRVDASKRRKSFRRKIGVGMKYEEFLEAFGKKLFTGHVGYAESILLIARSADLSLSRIEEFQEPVRAERDISAGEIVVKQGEVLGVRGYGIGYVDETERIRVEFQATVGGEECEEIILEGEDGKLRWKSSGTQGDSATANLLLSVAEKLKDLPKGLLTMADIIPFKIKFNTDRAPGKT